MGDVDVAGITKSERHPREDQHHRKTDGRDAESAYEGPPLELGPQYNFPTNLKMKGEGADETWSTLVPLHSQGFLKHLLHITTTQPPKSKKEPEKAQERLEYMSLGVIAL